MEQTLDMGSKSRAADWSTVPCELIASVFNDVGQSGSRTVTHKDVTSLYFLHITEAVSESLHHSSFSMSVEGCPRSWTLQFCKYVAAHQIM